MELNDSTLSFVRKTLEETTRLAILRLKTMLYCHECRTVNPVTDVFSNKECLLECGHRRSIFTDPEAVTRFKTAEASQRKRAEVGKSKANQWVHVYEEPLGGNNVIGA